MKERKLADSTEDHKKILILTSLGRTISLKFYSSRSASACSLASGVWMSSFIRLRSWFVASTLRCLCSVCKWLEMRIRELCLHRSKLLWTSPEKRCVLHIHKLLYFPVSASLAGTKFFESKVQQNLVDSHSHWFRHQIANTWELGNVLLYWYETTQSFCRCSELLLKWAVHRTIKYDLWLVKSGPETNWCSHMLINCSPVLCLCCLLRLFPKPLPELMSV